VWAIVVAAGSGERFGGPKQLEMVAGRRVVDWSIAAARAVSDGVVLVVSPEWAAAFESEATITVAGGATRSESVRNGLAAVPDAAEVVVVHDAARPCATVELFEHVVAALVAHRPRGVSAVIPGIGLTDTIKLVDDSGHVVATPDRALLRAVQTPQAFDAAALRRAHTANADADRATDDATLIEAAGGVVLVVPGHIDNIKITEAGDAVRAEAILVSRKGV
jgi:2-C-methyl-D-erythritol 4-phosphate cytidylyltransferase